MNNIDLSPVAIITEEKCLQYLDHDTETQGSLVKYINYASRAIASHCGRNLVRSQNINILDSYGDRTIRLPTRPIVSIESLRYDTTRVFNVDTELVDEDGNATFTFSAELGIINLPQDYGRGPSVFRVVVVSGYDRIAFMQRVEPSVAVDGDIWLLTDGTMFKLTAGVWTPYFGQPMPEDLEGACAEYVSYLKNRFRIGGVGLIAKRRGVGQEGADIAYEHLMPGHIKERLEPYASRAI